MHFHVIELSELEMAGLMRTLSEARKNLPVNSDLWHEPLYVHRTAHNKGLNNIQKRFHSDQDCLVFLTPNYLGLLRNRLRVQPLADISESELPALHHLSKL